MNEVAKLDRLEELIDLMGGNCVVYITKGEAEIEGEIELYRYIGEEIEEARSIINELREKMKKGGEIKMKELEAIRKLKEEATLLLQKVEEVKKQLREEHIMEKAVNALERAATIIKEDIVADISSAEAWLEMIEDYLERRKEG